MSNRRFMIILAPLVVINICLLAAILTSWTRCRSYRFSKDHLLMQERIVGGHKAPIEKYRFIAALMVVKHYRLPEDAIQCGCSIISRRWVLSAAHCIKFIEDADVDLQYVKIASNNKEWKKGRRHQVVKMIKNSNYDENVLCYDTSVLQVKEPFISAKEVPIAIVGPGFKYPVNATATVIGWGHNQTNSPVTQDTLFSVDVKIFSQNYCYTMYGKAAVTSDMFCAGDYKGGKDACQFDSGGPIIMQNVLIGVISWGGNCGDVMEPGVYARLSEFHSWLKQTQSESKQNFGYKVENITVGQKRANKKKL